MDTEQAPSIVTRTNAKKVFLDFFNDNEIWKILNTKFRYPFSLMPLSQSVERPSFRIRKYVLMGVSITYLYKTLHMLAFGVQSEKEDLAIVVSAFEEIRKKLELFPLPSMAPSINPPPRPEGMIRNNLTGNIKVSDHAWERFCVRYLTSYNRPVRFYSSSQKTLWQQLAKLFQFAEKTELPRKKSIRRLINNGFERVRYFLHTGSRLRFVLAESEPILITVEVVNDRKY